MTEATPDPRGAGPRPAAHTQRMHRTKSALSIFAVAGLLTLMGCSSDSDDAATTTTAPAADVTTTEATAETTMPEPETTVSGGTDTGPNDTAMGPGDTTPVTVGPSVEPTRSRITVTVDGTGTDINPDKVYCSGEEGNIRHIIGKTNDQPPLVEATPGEFAMVKTQEQGAPYKAENTTGITFGDTSATFDNVTMGAATVSGDLVCTDWED